MRARRARRCLGSWGAVVALGVAGLVCVVPAVTGTAGALADTPTVADASSAPDEASAAVIASTYDHSVHVTGLDDAYSTTSVNADGSMSKDLSSTPIRVQQADGSWQPVDLSLQQNSDGTFSPAMSPASVVLGGAGSQTVATLAVGSGSVSYGWSSALPAPTVSGSTATYANVEPGVDVVANVTTSGVETSVVFDSASAAAAGPVDLSVTASGLTATKSSAGVVSYADSSGAVVAQTPTPQAWDSELGGDQLGPGAGPVAKVAGALRTAAGSVLSPTAGAGDVTAATGVMTDQLQVPSSLLSDPATVYPLVLDPGVDCTSCTEGIHGYVENDGYNEIDSSFDGGLVHVGTFDGGTTVTRGLFAFLQGDIHGQHIDAASLKLHDVGSWSCTGEPVTVYNSAYIYSGSNWSNATIGSLSDTSGSFAYGYDSSCPANLIDVPVTNIVAAAAASSSGTIYFQIRTDESNDLYWKKFDPNETLSVTYQSIPATPTGLSVSHCWVKCSSPAVTRDNTPALTAKATTADGEHLIYRWTVDGTTQAPADTYETGDTATYSWPSGLADGSHSYTVKACDWNSSICSASSDTFSFTVEHDTMPAPTATSTDFDLANGSIAVGHEYTPGTVTVSDTSSAMYEFAYSLIPGTTIVNAPICDPSVGTITSGSVSAVCGSNISAGSAALTITPTGMVNTVTVEALDEAGNAASTPWTFTVNTLSENDPDHAWSTSTAQDGAASVNDWSGASPSLPLTRTGSATWAGAGNGPNNGDDALNFTGTFSGSTPSAATTASTNSLVIDGTHSMTVSAWVDPSAASLTDGVPHTAVAMDGAQNSQFYLQMAPSGSSDIWRFCMPTTQASPGGVNCVNSTGAATTGWTFLAAVWDSAAQTMSLYVDNNASVSASHNTIPAAANGAITVGRAEPRTGLSVADWNLWIGQIADVCLYNGVLAQNQVQVLSEGNTPS